MLIVAKMNINETYKKTSLLCFQVLEVEAYRFSNDHYDEK